MLNSRPYPSFLALNIPTRFWLSKPFQPTNEISIQPGGAGRFTGADGKPSFFGNSIVFVEADPPSEQWGPTDWQTKVVSYQNLREFILFWSFLSQEEWSIEAFERGVGPLLLDCPPHATPTAHKKEQNWELNPSFFPIEETHLSLASAFAQFKNSDQKYRDCIGLLAHRPNRYVAQPSRSAYNNYLLKTSLIWFVIDVLLPAEKCEASVTCPKCGKDSRTSHPTHTFLERARAALAGFAHADDYAALLDKARKARGSFVHAVVNHEFPETNHGEFNPETKRRFREVTRLQTISDFGTEGLATRNALLLLQELARWLLFNRIFPDMNIWPALRNLKQVSTA